MISKFNLFMVGLFLGVGSTVTTTPTTKKVLVKEVDNLDMVSKASYDDSYLGTIFYQSVDERKNDYVNNIKSRETNKGIEIDVD